MKLYSRASVTISSNQQFGRTLDISYTLQVENINPDSPEIELNPRETSEMTERALSPNNPPWNSAIAFALWAVSVLLIIVVPAVFLIPYLISQNIDLSNQQQLANFAQKDPTSIILQIGAIIPAHIITIALAWFVVTKVNKHSFTEMLGWEWGGFKWWHVVLLLLGVFTLGVATTSLLGQQDNDLLRILRSSRYVVFLVAFMATFSAPIVEEVVYRGVLYSAFQRTFGVAAAVGLVTFVFALVHFPQYWGDYATLITLTALSLVITLIRVVTNNLLPCIVFHFVFNGIQSVLLVLQPYLPEALDGTKPSEAFYYLLIHLIP